jgi:hypothetical protein
MKGNGRNVILWLLIFSGVLFFIQSLRTARVAEKEIPILPLKPLCATTALKKSAWAESCCGAN